MSLFISSHAADDLYDVPIADVGRIDVCAEEVQVVSVGTTVHSTRPIVAIFISGISSEV